MIPDRVSRDRTGAYRRLEEVSPSFLLKKRILADLLREICPSPVARSWDAGCGAGTLSLLLGRYTREELVVTDIERSSVDMSLERLASNEGPRVTGQVLDLESGPAPAGTFDLILCWAVLEHLERDREGLALLAAALAPGGRLIINVPLHPRLMNSLDRLEHHHRRYTPQELISLLTENRMGLEHFRFFGFPSLLITKVLWAGFSSSEARVVESSAACLVARTMSIIDHAFYRARFPWGVEGVLVAFPTSGK